MKLRKEHVLVAALAACSAAAPALAAGVEAQRSAADSTSAFVPPRESMVLTRELRKVLGDGQVFTARRSYAIRFVPDGEGWRVEGSLLASEVEAPPGVPPQLAELERTRPDTGLFPLRLDRAGMILEQQGARDPRTSAALLDQARATLARSSLSDAERKGAEALVVRLQAQARAAGGNWPADLFHPRAAGRSETRNLPLVAGLDGQIRVTVAVRETPAGLMERMERKVVTEAGGTSRTSVETWTLARSR